MKPGKIILGLVIIAIAIVIFVNKCGNEKSTAKGGRRAPQEMSVSAVVAKESVLEESIYSSGTLLPNEEVEIRNEIAGRIIQLNFKEGSRIDKGDLLVKIYDADLKAQLKKLELEREIAGTTEQRQKDLLTVNGVSRQDYDEALNRLHTIEADIELLKSQLSKTEIRAPFSGVIGLRNVSEGAFLAVNTPITTLLEIDRLKLEFDVPEKYRNLIEDNSEVEFTTEASPEKFTAKIYAYQPGVNQTTRTVKVRALYDNKNRELFPGAFINVTIPLKKVEDALLVPTQALIPELRAQTMYIARNGKAKKIVVEPGLRNDSMIQVTSGLSAGDTVIITGIMQMRPDMDIRVSIVN